MALIAKHAEMQFGVGDTVRVHQKIVESGKSRTAVFEGMVIGIKGRESGKSFTVRKIGAQKIGIEQIFPLLAPTIEKVEVVRRGTAGSHHAKLFFTRTKSRKEIEQIYSRAAKREKKEVVPNKAKKKVIKRASKKTSKSK